MGNSGWPGKTRLGKDAYRCLLLLGTLVSQENCCRMLLLVGSCWWGILVRQEKLGWGKLLVGGDAEWLERKNGLGKPNFGSGASTAWLGVPSVKPRGLLSEDGLGGPNLCWGSFTPLFGGGVSKPRGSTFEGWLGRPKLRLGFLRSLVGGCRP